MASGALLARPAGGARVAVARRMLPAGTAVDPADLRFVTVAAPEAVVTRLVGVDGLDRLTGRRLAATVRPGDPLVRSTLERTGGGTTRRIMSIPVARARAVNGRLARGDRVDVVVVTGATVATALSDLEVVAVDDVGGAFAGADGDLAVTLAVDARQAELLAAAVAEGEFVLARVRGPVAGGRP